MSFLKLSIVGVMALSQLACTSWPRYGYGGEADRFAASHYYEPAASRYETQGHLLSQLETQQAQLDVLTLQGADYCIPASVKKMTLLGNRVRREIQGQLWRDAAHNLVVLQHELRFFRQQFITVAQQTGCALKQIETAAIIQPIFSIYFDSDQAEISATYQQQINWWGQHFNAQTRLRVRAYTDAHGSESSNEVLAQQRLNQVINVLQTTGVDRANIDSEFLGERELILNGTDDFANGLNRRVDIWVLPDSSNTQQLPVMQWESLELKLNRHVMPSWQ